MTVGGSVSSMMVGLRVVLVAGWKRFVEVDVTVEVVAEVRVVVIIVVVEGNRVVVGLTFVDTTVTVMLVGSGGNSRVGPAGLVTTLVSTTSVIISVAPEVVTVLVGVEVSTAAWQLAISSMRESATSKPHRATGRIKVFFSINRYAFFQGC